MGTRAANGYARQQRYEENVVNHFGEKIESNSCAAAIRKVRLLSNGKIQDVETGKILDPTKLWHTWDYSILGRIRGEY